LIVSFRNSRCRLRCKRHGAQAVGAAAVSLFGLSAVCLAKMLEQEAVTTEQVRQFIDAEG